VKTKSTAISETSKCFVVVVVVVVVVVCVGTRVGQIPQYEQKVAPEGTPSPGCQTEGSPCDLHYAELCPERAARCTTAAAA